MARITKVEAFAVGLPLCKPMRLASEIITVAENLFVRITASDGIVGWGEAASAPTMTGDLLPGMTSAVRRFIGPALQGASTDDVKALEAVIGLAISANTGAKAAVCMALYDLVARQRGKPLHALLGLAQRTQIPALQMLGSGDVARDASDARAGFETGFRNFKLKVGIHGPVADAQALAAVRAAIGPDAELTADANMAWGVVESMAFLQAAKYTSLAYLEQPLSTNDLTGLRVLTGAGLGAIAADEAIHAVSDIEATAAAGVRWFGLKLIKLGGYGSMARAVECCSVVGGLPILACKIAESSVGAAAMAHLAVTVPVIETGVSFTHGYLRDDITLEPLPIRMGKVTLPDGPGHGVTVTEERIRHFQIG